VAPLQVLTLLVSVWTQLHSQGLSQDQSPLTSTRAFKGRGLCLSEHCFLLIGPFLQIGQVGHWPTQLHE
jgi:hypothetical protein